MPVKEKNYLIGRSGTVLRPMPIIIPPNIFLSLIIKINLRWSADAQNPDFSTGGAAAYV